MNINVVTIGGIEEQGPQGYVGPIGPGVIEINNKPRFPTPTAMVIGTNGVASKDCQIVIGNIDTTEISAALPEDSVLLSSTNGVYILSEGEPISLQGWMRAMEERVMALEYAPPGAGGVGYEGALNSYNSKINDKP